MLFHQDVGMETGNMLFAQEVSGINGKKQFEILEETDRRGGG
jgi:hypothetical protein